MILLLNLLINYTHERNTNNSLLFINDFSATEAVLVLLPERDYVTFEYMVSQIRSRLSVVSNVRACLPDYVVNVESVEVFKKRLDKFWSNQPVKFDWRASLTGTGDRSEF